MLFIFNLIHHNKHSDLGGQAYLASIWDGLDVRVVVVGHLLIIGTQETQRLVVAVARGVVPRHRLVAAVGEVLPGWGCQ